MDWLSKAWSRSDMAFVSRVALSKIQYHKEITQDLFTVIECDSKENLFVACFFKTHSHRVKVEAKAKISFEVCRFSSIFLAFASAFLRCERANIT